MSEGSSKSVKIAFEVDRQGIEKVRRAILDLKHEVQGLVDATSKVGGGLLGGAQVGNVGKQIGTSPGTQISQKVGGPVGNLTTNLYGAVAASANLFKAASQSTQTAFKGMEEGLKNLVRTSDSEITRLKRTLEGLGPAFKVVGGLGSGGGNSRAALMAAFSPGAAARGGLPGGMGLGGGGLGGPGGPGLGGPPAPPPPSGGGGGGGGLLGGIAKAFGIPVGALGATAAATAGINLGNGITNAAYTNALENTKYALDAPMFRLNAAAQLGDIYGGNSQAIRKGDMGRVWAMKQLAKDEALAQISKQDAVLNFQRDLEHPNNAGIVMAKNGFLTGLVSVGAAATGTALGGPAGMGGGSKVPLALTKSGAIPGRKTSSVGEAALRNAGALPGGPDYNQGNFGAASVGVGNTNVLDLDRMRANNENMAQTAQRAQDALMAKMRSNPAFVDRMNEFYANSGSDSALLRAAGMGGGNVKLKDGSLITEAGLLKSRAEAAGRQASEYTSAGQSLAATAGRGFLGFGVGGGTLSPMTGGLSNVNQILNMGGQYGTGNIKGPGGAKDFLNTIQGLIGRSAEKGVRGLDVTAGVGIANVGMGMMQAGNFSAEGRNSLMETLMAAGAGGNVGNDMRFARNMEGGIAGLNRVASGAVDPYQQAVNFAGAMKGGSGSYSANYAVTHQMTAADRIQFIRTGKVPSRLAEVGVTANQMRSTISAQDAALFSRVRGEDMGGPAGVAVREYNAHHGDLSYFKSKTLKEREKTAELLGNASVSAGSGLGTVDEATDAIRARLGALKLLRVHGRGAHGGLKKGTTTDIANRTRSKLTADEAKQNAAEGKEYEEAYKNAPAARAAEDKARADSQKHLGGAADSNKVIGDVTSALQNLISFLQQTVAGPIPGTAGAGHKVGAKHHKAR